MQRSTGLTDLVRSVTGFDIGTEFGSFETRLAFQKALYLLQATGVIANKHSFNYYARGPYSPGWARDGFASAGGEDIEVALLREPEPLAIVIRMHPRDSGWLEALASLHWYLHVEGRTKEQARARAAEKGKTCLVDRFDEAYSALGELFGPNLSGAAGPG